MRMDRRAGLLAAGESAIGTWVFNAQLTLLAGGTEYNINFTSKSTSYSRINFWDAYYAAMLYDDTAVFTGYGWVNSGYKTIVITGGADANNPDLLTWLKNNATRS